MSGTDNKGQGDVRPTRDNRDQGDVWPARDSGGQGDVRPTRPYASKYEPQEWQRVPRPSLRERYPY